VDPELTLFLPFTTVIYATATWGRKHSRSLRGMNRGEMKCAQAATAPPGVSGRDVSNCRVALPVSFRRWIFLTRCREEGPLFASLGSLGRRCLNLFAGLLGRKFGLIVPVVLVPVPSPDMLAWWYSTGFCTCSWLAATLIIGHGTGRNFSLNNGTN